MRWMRNDGLWRLACCLLTGLGAIGAVILVASLANQSRDSQMFFLLLAFACFGMLLLSVVLYSFWEEQHQAMLGFGQLFFSIGGLFSGLVSFYRYELSALAAYQHYVFFSRSGGIVHMALLAMLFAFLYVALRHIYHDTTTQQYLRQVYLRKEKRER